MDKIEKELKKLAKKEKEKVKEIFKKLENQNIEDLDTKKLKGKNNIFRIRKGYVRIIFQKNKNSIKILTIERRGDNTYKM